ncbi:hypothetical protein Tco_0597754 [Tanacetum coccineum]
MVRCSCGLQVVIRTSLTNWNHGRRFYGSPAFSPTCINLLWWFDLPMCQRFVQIIPGLLRSRNELEEIVRDDKGIKWLDVEEPLDLVNISEELVYESKNGYEYRGRNFMGLGRDIYLARPFIEIVCLAINRKYGLMTFTDGIKEITFKTPYKDLERSELSSEGHDLLSSRIILSEDDYDRGCRKPSDLENGFYKDTIMLGPEYVTGMDDE